MVSPRGTCNLSLTCACLRYLVLSARSSSKQRTCRDEGIQNFFETTPSGRFKGVLTGQDYDLSSEHLDGRILQVNTLESIHLHANVRPLRKATASVHAWSISLSNVSVFCIVGQHNQAFAVLPDARSTLLVSHPCSACDGLSHAPDICATYLGAREAADGRSLWNMSCRL